MSLPVWAAGQRDLGAGDRAQTPRSGALGKLHRSVEVVVVREGEGLVPQLPRPQRQLFDVRGALEEREVGVGVEFSVGRYTSCAYVILLPDFVLQDVRACPR